ncbi:MAG: cold shock domain-containing protein, partial [Planctomycetaceae bacterium]
MPLGQIKTLTDRGFGFIASNDGADVFFHMSTLESGSQFDMLREGQPVEYEADSGDRGPRATMVRIVEDGAAAPVAAAAETDDVSAPAETDGGTWDAGEAADDGGTCDAGDAADDGGTCDAGDAADDGGTCDAGETADDGGTCDAGDAADDGGTCDAGDAADDGGP